MMSVTVIYESFIVYHTSSWNIFQLGKNGNITCAEVKFSYHTISIGLKFPQGRTQVSGDTVQYLKYKILLSSFSGFSTTDHCCSEEGRGKPNKPPTVENKLKMWYFLLNILSVCKGFLSYSPLQFYPVSATWVILLFYTMCIVKKQIRKICISLGAGWRTLWFYLLYLLLVKCLCFLVTICIFFHSLLNMSRIYICCLNSCVGKILLGPILWYFYECILQTTCIPGVSV